MRLTDLNAEFLSDTSGRVGHVIFDCPCGDSDENHRCCIPFTPALDGAPYLAGGTAWSRTGETLVDLTLSPSILRVEGCKWHGWIRNGEVIGC